jgi:hypothetical protein
MSIEADVLPLLSDRTMRYWIAWRTTQSLTPVDKHEGEQQLTVL